MPLPEGRSNMRRFSMGACVLAGVLLASFASQAAIWVAGDRATLAWEPASGPVASYGVWLRRNGESFGAEPTLWVGETSAAIWASQADLPEQVVVRVAAYDQLGRRGPFSTESEPFVFYPEPENPAPLVDPARPFDLDGNGTTDLLWTESNGDRLMIWLMEDGTARQGGGIFTLRPNQRIVGSGDFDADGHADLLLEDTATGGLDIWLMEGTRRRESRRIPSRAGWTIEALGDFDGDGRSDLLGELWGEVNVSFLDGAAVVAEAALGVAPEPSRWEAPDLDGDLRADVLFHGDVTSSTWRWVVDGDRVVQSGSALRPPWSDAELAGCGDVDGDGRDDLLWLNPGFGGLRFWFNDGLGSLQVTSWLYSDDEYAFGLSDYDGDGRANEVLIRNVASGENWIARYDWDGVSGSVFPQRVALPTLEPGTWDPVEH